jgi:enoyl-CoA hydratase/carnithine racemase
MARKWRFQPLGSPGRDRRSTGTAPWASQRASDPPVATITLNRPEYLNTIVPPMPDEIQAAIDRAERDPAVKVVVLRGAGRAFSGGYDFGGGFGHWAS